MLRIRLILMTTLALLTLGCRREDPYPELHDPIYKFLKDQTNSLKSSVESETKKIEELEKAVAKTQPLTHARKLAIRDLESTKRRIASLNQEMDYLTIRTERRRVEARRDYKIAFLSHKDWPDPKEFDHFMTQHRLRKASRHWDARVPKLQDRILATWSKPEKASKAKEK